MPYSTDSDENTRNPVAPSPVVLTDQLIYRIASLDASVQSGFRRLDEKMDRLQNDMHDRHIEVNDRINVLDKEVSEGFLRKRQRLDDLEKNFAVQKQQATERYNERCVQTDKRISEVETWQKVMLARISVAFTAIMIVWTILAPTLRHIVGIANG